MSDHDPLAEALHSSKGRHNAPWPTRQLCPGATYHAGRATDIRAALDAAGYEVRLKLTVERVAAALLRARWYTSDSQADAEIAAAAILAALDAAP